MSHRNRTSSARNSIQHDQSVLEQYRIEVECPVWAILVRQPVAISLKSPALALTHTLIHAHAVWQAESYIMQDLRGHYRYIISPGRYARNFAGSASVRLGAPVVRARQPCLAVLGYLSLYIKRNRDQLETNYCITIHLALSFPRAISFSRSVSLARSGSSLTATLRIPVENTQASRTTVQDVSFVIEVCRTLYARVCACQRPEEIDDSLLCSTLHYTESVSHHVDCETYAHTTN